MDFLPIEIWIYIMDFLSDPCNFLLVNKYALSLFKYQKNLNKELLKNIATNGYLDILKYIFELGNKKDDLFDCFIIDKNDMLITSSGNGHLEMVIFLTERGANIRTNNDYAIRWASYNGHLEIVKYLYSHGANIEANNDAIIWASHNGHLDVVIFLTERGADIKSSNNVSVRWAFENGHHEVVNYLMKRGAILNYKNIQLTRD